MCLVAPVWEEKEDGPSGRSAVCDLVAQVRTHCPPHSRLHPADREAGQVEGRVEESPS